MLNVPVSIYDTSSFSVLNIQSEYVTDPLVNNGKGKNYGVEISLERYLGNNFYGTFSTSLYQSKYTAADGIERDTKFNGNYLFNLVTGKEFILANKLKSFGVNMKTIYAGGLRRTPINEEKSSQAGYTVYHEADAFSIQNPAYFRTDIRVSMTWNRKRLTSTLSLDIQNVSNRLNIAGQYYDSEYNKLVTSYQTGIIPILNYKVEF
jgi:outer membrane receptor protein involved in Fe transport